MDAGGAALQQPLLPPSAPSTSSQGRAEAAAGEGEGEELRVEYEELVVEARGSLGEARRLLALAAPLSAGQVLSYLGYLIVVAQIGRRLGPLQLSAVSLGSTFFNITGLSL